MATDLSEHGLLVNEDHTVGTAADAHGDVQNLFNDGGGKGAGATMIVEALRVAPDRCYGTTWRALTRALSREGARPTSSLDVR